MMDHFKHPLVVTSVALSLVVVGVGYWYVSKPAASKATFIPVEKSALTEEVSVSGPVKSSAAVDLAFERAGKVSRVNVQVGDVVPAGTSLVALESADLAAGLAGAEASLASQQAKLAELTKGARTEDLALAQAQVANAQAALDDAQKSMTDKIEDAYTKSDQAIHNTADAFFSNPTTDPKISFTMSDSQLEITLEGERVQVGNTLISWRSSLDAGAGTSSEAKKNLDQLRDFLSKAATALTKALPGNGISQDMIGAWRVNVATAQTNLNASYAALTSGEDAIRNAQSALAVAKDQLTLKQAGATQEQLAGGQAAVDGAQAAVDAARAQLEKTVIHAPIDGTITRQDAHVGAIASPNIPLVSMISSAQFQIEAYVSEADIARIHSGDEVSVSLDAYGSGVSFPATVASVDPSATQNQGVPSYRVVLQFKDKDERIKAGMTANARIVTARKDSALAIPWSSVIERNGNSFVLVKTKDNTTSEHAVVTGIRSGDLVEVVSGLNEGDAVASFGINQ